MDEPPIITYQFRSLKDTKKEEATDDGGGHLVCTYAADALRIPAAMV